LATLASLALFACAGAGAQGVYKTVGPDGKITYTDKPPAPGSKADVVKITPPPLATPAAPAAASAASAATSPASRPVGNASADDESEERPGKRRTAKKALAQPQEAPPEKEAPPKKEALDPAVETAVVRVLLTENLIKQQEELCIGNLPTSAKTYSAAVDQWQTRNRQLVAQAREIMVLEYPANKARLELGMQIKNQQILQDVAKSNAASKTKWCDRTANDISGGKMDVSDKVELVKPIIGYHKK
jgi:hypothetical protein